MADFCSCGDGVTAFGQPTCVPSFGRDAKLIFVQYFDNLGAVNSIKSTDVLDSTYFEDLINAGAGSSVIDKSKRWNITETINNVVGERAENVTQDIDGIPLNVKQGTRTYDGTFYGNVAATPYVKALESMSCSKMGYFIVDVNGNIVGIKNDLTGDLDPIKIQSNTLQVKYKYPNATEVQNINMKFAVEENERDADLNFIAASTIAVDVLDLSSVIQVNGVASALATTGAAIAESFSYGSVFAPILFEGADPTDFIAFNDTTQLAVAIITAPEAPLGTYTFTWSAQTPADVITVSVDKIGFTGAVTFTTP